MCRDYFESTKLRFPDYDNSILNIINSVLLIRGVIE
jgi:hypothetical protein